MTTDDTALAALASALEEALREDRCMRCGGPLHGGAGLCPDCFDWSLLDMAATLGVGAIVPDDPADLVDGSPGPGHVIWGILERTLAKKAPGDALDDVWPVLTELALLTPLDGSPGRGMLLMTTPIGAAAHFIRLTPGGAATLVESVPREERLMRALEISEEP